MTTTLVSATGENRCAERAASGSRSITMNASVASPPSHTLIAATCNVSAGTATGVNVPMNACPARPGVAAIASPSGAASGHHHHGARQVLRTIHRRGSTASRSTSRISARCP